MKIGVIVEAQEGLGWDAWRRLAACIEALGFDSLWRSDHLLSTIDEGREANDTWVALTVAALETKRLQIGSLVSPLTFRHPAMLAKVAASVDTLSAMVSLTSRRIPVHSVFMHIVIDADMYVCMCVPCIL